MTTRAAGSTIVSSTSTSPPKHQHHEGANIALKSILSGSIAGIASTCLFHPADVLRTKIQSAGFSPSRSGTGGSNHTGGGGGGGGVAGKPTRPLATLMNTFRNGGVRALYTGVTPVLGAQAVYKACVFSVNNVTMSKITAYKTRDGGTYTPTLFDIWFCGVCGGCVNGTAFVSPVEFVRNQQIALHSRASTAEGTSSEAMRRKMKTPIDIIRQTLRREGILGLWRGTGVTVLRDSLGCGGFFVMNELGKRCLGPHLGGRESKATFLAAGACAGWGVSRVICFDVVLVAVFLSFCTISPHITVSSSLVLFAQYWAFALPLDTLKAIVQTGGASSAREILIVSIERDGLARTCTLLLRGWQLAFGRGAPSAAITLTVYSTLYELTSRYL